MWKMENGVSVQKLTKYPSRLRIPGKWGQCAKIDKISVTIAHPRKMGSDAALKSRKMGSVCKN
jgi:hypothetical protein